MGNTTGRVSYNDQIIKDFAATSGLSEIEGSSKYNKEVCESQCLLPFLFDGLYEYIFIS